jgi:hypothetical protein
LQRISVDRLGDVLELGLAEIGDREIEPTLDLPVGLLGETDSARFANTFQPRGDVDAVAHQVAVALLDDIAEVDADPELDAALGRDARIALDHGVLQFDRAVHRVDHAAEFDNGAISGALDDAAVVDRNGGVDHVAAQRPEPRQDAILVRAGEPGVSDHVGSQDRRDFPGLAHCSASPALRRPSNTAGRFGVWSIIHLTVILGLSRRASAKAVLASSILPACA